MGIAGDGSFSGGVDCENLTVRGSANLANGATVIHDATLSGAGTTAFPLGVVASGVLTFPVVNTDVIPIAPGMPVTSSGKVATATTVPLATICGIATTPAAPGFAASVQGASAIVLPAATWDARTGQVGGLTPGARYYVGTFTGSLTIVAPITVGLFVAFVGVAVDAQTLVLEIDPPILL